LGSAVTGLLFGLTPQELIVAALQAAADPLTLRLLAIVLLITFMSQILRDTLQLEGMIRSLSALFVDRRWLLPLMPMLIGLLPMAGGAMFSAPMVEEASQGMGLSPDRRTFINYWFRHALETVFPLYPSLILAAGLMHVSAQTLTLNMLPVFGAALVGGVLFGMAGIGRAPQPAGHSTPGPAGRRSSLILLLKSIWPIAMVLILALVLGVDLVLALVLTVISLVLAHRLRPRQIVAVIRSMPLGIVPVIVGAMVFQQVLETSGAVEAISSAFTRQGVPVPLVVFFVPLVAAFLTGLAAAAFAISFPIVFSLCPPDLVGSGYGLLAYTGGTWDC
jgi:hypothetical protein